GELDACSHVILVSLTAGCWCHGFDPRFLGLQAAPRRGMSPAERCYLHHDLAAWLAASMGSSDGTMFLVQYVHRACVDTAYGLGQGALVYPAPLRHGILAKNACEGGNLRAGRRLICTRTTASEGAGGEDGQASCGGEISPNTDHCAGCGQRARHREID